MKHCCVLGASGYTGMELAGLIQAHPAFQLTTLGVSENSADANKTLMDLYPGIRRAQNLPLTPIDECMLSKLSLEHDAIFLATPHQVSHDWIEQLAGKRAKIFDLSGAFRLKAPGVYPSFYGFEHQHQDLLQGAVYGLVDWHASKLKDASLVAVPGCYPTASLTALKPLVEASLLDSAVRPIINAVSGVSGAGRKAALSNSFCEVSLQAYGVLGHRHQPEISEQLGTDVIFTPHLGNFKRGILATVTVKVNEGTCKEDVDAAFESAYANTPLVRMLKAWPRLDDVVHSPYVDLHWKLDEQSGYLVIVSALDNLLKGASSQALQCANLAFGYQAELGLLQEIPA